MRIVLEMKMPVIVRLGSFHFLKSILGCVGYIMKDCGLENIVQKIYPGNVDHIMSGGSYYKALRAQFLVDAALCSYLLENYFDKGELEEMEEFIKKCKQEMLGAQYTNRVIQKFDKKISKKLKEVADSGRTPFLWVTYHNLVTKIKTFIRAERLHNWDLHLATVTDMLPFFTAAGHGQYAKGGRLYLEMMDRHAHLIKRLMDKFKSHGLHAV